MIVLYKKLLNPYKFQFPRSIRFFQNPKRLSYLERRQLFQKRILDALTSVLNNRKCLTVDEWREFRSSARMRKIIYKDTDILTALKLLETSKDPLRIANSFVQACEIDRDVIVMCTYIELYVAKEAVEKLAPSEEKQLINM